MSKHLKKYVAPKSWPISKKDAVYITKPAPGPHSQRFGMSLDLILRLLGYAKTKREIKKILSTKEIQIDGKRVKDSKILAGLFDVISIPALNQYFRIIIDKNCKLRLKPVQKTEASKKITKIIGKTMLKNGKTQLNLSDGRNIVSTDKKYSVGDCVLIEVPSQKIQEHMKLEPGTIIYLSDGKYVGDSGRVESADTKMVVYVNVAKQKVSTLKDYAYAVGKEQAMISLE